MFHEGDLLAAVVEAPKLERLHHIHVVHKGGHVHIHKSACFVLSLISTDCLVFLKM